VRDVLEAIVSAGTIDAWCVISRFSKGKKVTDRVASVLNCSDENLDLAIMAMGEDLEEVFSCGMIVLLSLGGVKDGIISVAPTLGPRTPNLSVPRCLPTSNSSTTSCIAIINNPSVILACDSHIEQLTRTFGRRQRYHNGQRCPCSRPHVQDSGFCSSHLAPSRMPVSLLWVT
jgi:hypothetical protein